MFATLREQIVADSNFFESMLKLLPSQLITDKQDDDDVDRVEDDNDININKKDINKKGVNKGNKKKAGKKRKAEVIQTVDKTIEDENLEHEEDLQTKLKNKIESLKAQRCKPGSAEYQERNRLKRRLSKAKLKERRKQEKKSKLSESSSTYKPIKDESSIKTESTKLKLDNEDKIVFNKFGFINESDPTKKKKSDKKKSKNSVPTGRNYKQLLEKAAKQQQKLDQLEQVDHQKAQDLKQKILWQKVLSKAEGVKVKDDVELIKKSLKHKVKKSERSKKLWKQREQGVKNRMEARQEKRKTNIAKRKEMKKDKKSKKKK